MVAISLYKGNLHKVATDVPRRWLIPTPKISLKDFRQLLRRRAKALSRLQSTSEVDTTAVPATSNPNPNPIAADDPFSEVEPQIVPLPVEEPPKEEQEQEEAEVEGDKATVAKAADAVEVPEKLVEGSDVVLETKVDVLQVEKSDTPLNPSGQKRVFNCEAG